MNFEMLARPLFKSVHGYVESGSGTHVGLSQFLHRWVLLASDLDCIKVAMSVSVGKKRAKVKVTYTTNNNILRITI